MWKRIKRWLRGCVGMRRRGRDEWDGYRSDEGLRDAVRRHTASTRLVRMHAGRSAKAPAELNQVLALKARAIEAISAAEEAIAALDRLRHDK